MLGINAASIKATDYLALSGYKPYAGIADSVLGINAASIKATDYLALSGYKPYAGIADSVLGINAASIKATDYLALSGYKPYAGIADSVLGINAASIKATDYLALSGYKPYAGIADSALGINAASIKTTDYLIAASYDRHRDIASNVLSFARHFNNTLSTPDHDRHTILPLVFPSEKPVTPPEGHELNLLSEVARQLEALSPDLLKRWLGALFAVNERNPDAARHFSASVREILIELVDRRIVDSVVVEFSPECERTDKGSPTRREKIRYLVLRKEGVSDIAAQEIENVVELMHLFNKGTHQNAGHFSHNDLRSMQLRVERGLKFLSRYLH